jgi:hypothetical protein
LFAWCPCALWREDIFFGRDYLFSEVKNCMPNEKVLSEKQAIVAELTEKLKSAGGVLVDYSGITVVEDTEMRRAMRNAGVDYAVVKNTLTPKTSVLTNWTPFSTAQRLWRFPPKTLWPPPSSSASMPASPTARLRSRLAS